MFFFKHNTFTVLAVQCLVGFKHLNKGVFVQDLSIKVYISTKIKRCLVLLTKKSPKLHFIFTYDSKT